MSDLPNGWALLAISAVAEVNPRKSVDLRLEDLVSFVPMAAVDEIEGEIVGAVDRPYGQVARGFTHFRDGDVIFAKITPSMENGKAAVARTLTNRTGLGSTEFHVLRSSGAVAPDYLWRYLRQQGFRNAAEGVMAGAVGQQRVPADWLKSHVIPLAPLAEQKRIIAKLNALFARGASARRELTHLPLLIAQYRKQLLARAFSGALTAEWRREHGIEESDGVKRIGDLLNGIVGGKNLRCEEHPPRADEKGVVKVSAVTWGRFDPLASKTLPRSFVPAEKTKICPGDLLFSRANTLELVASAVIVEDAPANLYLSDKVLRLELPDADKPWLLWFLRSPAGRGAIEARATGNQLSMRNLSQDSLRRIEMPWPCADERAEIVQQVETAMAALDRVAADQQAAMRLIPELEGAILRKAFSGALLPQNPRDEPAQALFERLRNARNLSAERGSHPANLEKTPDRAPSSPTGRKKGTSVLKSRKDTDVLGKPYLTGLVQRMGGTVTSNALFDASDLPLVDFYQQLSIEHDRGWLEGNDEMVKAA